MNAFTHYWSNSTWDANARSEGGTLDHIAGNSFEERGVATGDRIYVVTVKQGRMFLLGRLTADRICNQQQAERERRERLWKAEQHVLSDHGTPMRYERQVPQQIVNQLRLGDGKPLRFSRPNVLDVQTLRTVRRLTPESATLLDTLIDAEATSGICVYPDEVSQPELFTEGATRTVSVNIHERNPTARAACIAHHGPRCHVCGLEFAKRYGEIGRDFIHVHHLKQLATIGDEYTVDPVTDLRPVCPNCHAMLHQQVPPLTIPALRKMLRP